MQTTLLFVSISLSFSSGNLNVRFWKRDLYLAGAVGSGRKLFKAESRHFLLGVYSLLWPAVQILMAVCWAILRGQHIYTVIKTVHSLLYIVEKCNFFSVVTWKDIIKYLENILNKYKPKSREISGLGMGWQTGLILPLIEVLSSTDRGQPQAAQDFLLDFPRQ